MLIIHIYLIKTGKHTEKVQSHRVRQHNVTAMGNGVKSRSHDLPFCFCRTVQHTLPGHFPARTSMTAFRLCTGHTWPSAAEFPAVHGRASSQNQQQTTLKTALFLTC